MMYSLKNIILEVIGIMNEIIEYEINNGDYKLKFLNMGCVITEYSYKGDNVVLAFSNYKDYRDNYTNLGSIVGRSAGRIRDGKIDGWQLPLNQDGKHTLHGGRKLQYKFYNVEVHESCAVLSLFDEEGDFPGNANIKVKFELMDDGLKQTICATSDNPTILNFTNHTYFNLGAETILDHKLQIEADQYFELDEDLLPVKLHQVKNTVFNFKAGKLIREAQLQGDDQFKYSKFIDHPFLLKGGVSLQYKERKLEIETNQECLVVYTGNYVADEKKMLANNMNHDYSGICLETQFVPNSIDLVTNYTSITNYKLS